MYVIYDPSVNLYLYSWVEVLHVRKLSKLYVHMVIID